MGELMTPYRMYELNEKMKVKALMELGETPEVKKRGLAEIRRFVKEQKNLVCCDDDVFFLAFLRKGKYDMKRVIKLMQNFFMEKKNHPEIFSTPDIEGVRKCLEMRIANVMPYRDRDGSVIMVFRAVNWNVEEIKFLTIVHFISAGILSAVEYEPTQVCGVKILINTKGISLSHIRHIQLRYIPLLARGAQTCIPVRIKGLHIINENKYVRFLWNLVSFYVGGKLRSRIHFHGTDYKEIHKFIDADVIPTDFGGDLKDDDPLFGLSELENNKDKYIERLSFGYTK